MHVNPLHPKSSFILRSWLSITSLALSYVAKANDSFSFNFKIIS